MTTITDDGLYRDINGNIFQFRKGHVVGDDATYERVGDWADAESGVKTEPAPENKAAPAPSAKTAKAEK